MKPLLWLKNSLNSYWQDEEGQTSLEYVLLVAVVVAIIVKFGKGMKTNIGSLVEDVFKDASDLRSQLRSD